MIGGEWVRLTRTARAPRPRANLARRVLQCHWVALFAAALVCPVAARQLAPGEAGWVAVFSAAVAVGVIASAWAWHRGADAGALAPLVAAWSVVVMIVYGGIGPSYNASKSHRDLAATLDRILPPDERNIMFFEELDEGLWFYLRDRTLTPVPGSQPRYNSGFDMDTDWKDGRLELDPHKRLDKKKQILVDWLTASNRDAKYVLIRDQLYDLFAPALRGLATPVHREQGVSRHGVVLLRLATPASVAADPDRDDETRRQ